MTVRELYLACGKLLKEQCGGDEVYIYLDEEAVANIKDCEVVATYLNVTRVEGRLASRGRKSTVNISH
jgi:hypothetical protein